MSKNENVLDGGITILFDNDGLSIEIVDSLSSVKIVKATLTPEQTVQALSRLNRTDCKITVAPNINVIGKKMIVENLDFLLPNGIDRYSTYSPKIREKLFEEAKRLCAEKSKDNPSEPWSPDNYFGSQDSFFSKGKEYWVRAIIRKWTKKIPNKEEGAGTSKAKSK
jgi:hypothetical protein